MKCVANSRSLAALSSTTLSLPSMLKSRVGNSRTYIRPIQRNLDLIPIMELPGGVWMIIFVLITTISCFIIYIDNREMFEVWRNIQFRTANRSC